MKNILLFTILCFSSCFCLDNNQKIIQQVIAEELAGKALTPEQKAEYLSQRIGEIGTKALQRGFDTSIYRYKNSFAFEIVPIWEGKRVPLTFFVYIWPPEEAALAHNPYNRAYETNIHGHPIPCALTVLSRSINQVSYVPLSNQRARFLEEETLYPGDAAIDDNNEPFVHKLVCREPGTKPALTLHAYGACTAREVMDIFHRTYSQYSYTSP